mmetsp:Transcript_81756/g.213295  ORF Transcript_81756/g.213295 Transcript_81756/m.213295 type:complete len:222 (-) Transcript_81756:1236-1901(-)
MVRLGKLQDHWEQLAGFQAAAAVRVEALEILHAFLGERLALEVFHKGVGQVGRDLSDLVERCPEALQQLLDPFLAQKHFGLQHVLVLLAVLQVPHDHRVARERLELGLGRVLLATGRDVQGVLFGGDAEGVDARQLENDIVKPRQWQSFGLRERRAAGRSEGVGGHLGDDRAWELAVHLGHGRGVAHDGVDHRAGPAHSLGQLGLLLDLSPLLRVAEEVHN